MKIKDEILGKEVIDESGVTIGKIKELDLDFILNALKTMEIKDQGISGKFGWGEKKVLPFHLVKKIGDKIMIKGHI